MIERYPTATRNSYKPTKSKARATIMAGKEAIAFVIDASPSMASPYGVDPEDDQQEQDTASKSIGGRADDNDDDDEEEEPIIIISTTAD